MSYILQINKGIDYIESNLSEELKLSEVAKAAGISQWHFQRIFSALTGETLKGYIRARRLGSALKQLLNTEMRIIEISVEARYESQESFTRAFQNAFGMTPGEFRKAKKPHLFIDKVRIDKDYLKHISKNISLLPEIIDQDKKTYVGMHTNLFGIDSDKNNMAEKLPELWQAFLPRMGEIPFSIQGAGYGLIRQNIDASGELDYFSVKEVTQITDRLPESMVAVQIPKQTYAKFMHKGEVKNINHTVNYIYSSWLLNSDHKHSYGTDIEEYGEKYHPTSLDSEIFYSIPITK